MTNSTTEHFMVSVTRDGASNDCRVLVQKLVGDGAVLSQLSLESGDEFIIDAAQAQGMFASSTPVQPAPAAAPPASVAAPPVAAAAAEPVAAHGDYPLHDGVARVEAGDIVPPTNGTSWQALPGGWSALANGTIQAAAAPSPAAPQPAAAPVAAAVAPVPAPAPAMAAPAQAVSSQSSQAAWSSMPGGWSTLAAQGETAAAVHGNYPLHDGVARVGAGDIVAPVNNTSWKGLPGGWAALAVAGR